jgi:hypothetical protein
MTAPNYSNANFAMAAGGKPSVAVGLMAVIAKAK